MSEFLTHSLLIWQIILGIWLLLKWIKTNIKFPRSPVLTIGESLQSGSPIGESKVKKDLGPIEVGVKKQIVITEADENTIKSDEVITGKVKTKKDKLKKLRGK